MSVWVFFFRVVFLRPLLRRVSLEVLRCLLRVLDAFDSRLRHDEGLSGM